MPRRFDVAAQLGRNLRQKPGQKFAGRQLRVMLMRVESSGQQAGNLTPVNAPFLQNRAQRLHHLPLIGRKGNQRTVHCAIPPVLFCSRQLPAAVCLAPPFGQKRQLSPPVAECGLRLSPSPRYQKLLQEKIQRLPQAQALDRVPPHLEFGCNILRQEHFPPARPLPSGTGNGHRRSGCKSKP